MEQQLRQSAVVTPDQIAAVARARAVAIKEHLMNTGGITEDRLFIVTSATPAWSGEGLPAEIAADQAAPADSGAAAPPAAERDERMARVKLSLTSD